MTLQHYTFLIHWHYQSPSEIIWCLGGLRLFGQGYCCSLVRTAVQTTKTIPFYFVWGMICPLDSGHLCEWESPNHTLAKMSPLPFNANDLHITCDFPSLLEHLYDWLYIFPWMLFPQDRPVWFTFVVRGVCLAARLEICSDVTCIPEWEILVSRLFPFSWTFLKSLGSELNFWSSSRLSV